MVFPCESIQATGKGMGNLRIPFNKPCYTGNEDRYVLAAMHGSAMAGDGPFTRKCQSWFEQRMPGSRALMTPSCTHALEMAALLLDLQPGDEVIMPSYTFVSTANAFVLRGVTPVFVDIRPDTMNIDESLIEPAITPRTRAIVVVHYGGVACEMDIIMAIANQHGLMVIEDAAQAVMASYKGRMLGSIGHLGAYSFHETKNVTSGGEGGLLMINHDRFASRAEVIREKGTNRSDFLRGMVGKYTWIDVGGSYLPSELQAAYLWGQLEMEADITLFRHACWKRYADGISAIARKKGGEMSLHVQAGCQHNAHMFYLKVTDAAERSELMAHLLRLGIGSAFHYVPLHGSPAGARYGRFHGRDLHTTVESERLLRLPLWYGMKEGDQLDVIRAVEMFYG